MKIIDFVLILLVLFVVIAGYLAWQNRASEKIMSAVIPTAFAAFIGVVLAVFVFGYEKPVSETFPSVFHYESKTKLPWFPPWGIGQRWISDAYLAPGMLKAGMPDVFNDARDPNGMLLYHHLLQWAIVNWMAHAYGGNWRAEILHFDLPDSREGSYRSTRGKDDRLTVLSTKNIESLLAGNSFSMTHPGIPPSIALPPGTNVTIKVPQQPEGEEGEIILNNDLFTLSIVTRLSGYKTTVGTYARLAGLSDAEDQKLFTAVYLVKIKAEFSRWKSGNPRTAEYKAWIQQLTSEFKGEFDEQAVWSRIKNDYLFRKEVEQLGPVK
jgi:hypothetical protein